MLRYFLQGNLRLRPFHFCALSNATVLCDSLLEKAPREQLLELLRDQFNLRMQKATGQLGQSHLLSQVKRDIARVKTVLNQQAGK